MPHEVFTNWIRTDVSTAAFPVNSPSLAPTAIATRAVGQDSQMYKDFFSYCYRQSYACFHLLSRTHFMSVFSWRPGCGRFGIRFLEYVISWVFLGFGYQKCKHIWVRTQFSNFRLTSVILGLETSGGPTSRGAWPTELKKENNVWKNLSFSEPWESSRC